MRKLLSVTSVLVLLVGFNAPLYYANATGIARDTFLARSNDPVSESSFTKAYTVTGTNTALVLYAEHTSTVTVNSCTYGGDPLTKVDSLNVYGTVQVDSWIRIGTQTGSNNIVCNYSGSDQTSFTAESYTGVGSCLSTGGSDAHNTKSWSSSTANETISTVTANSNDWITIYLRSSAGSYAASTNVSLQDNVANIALMGDTGAAIVSPGSTNQTFTQSGSANSGGILTVALCPFVQTSVNFNFWQFFAF